MTEGLAIVLFKHIKDIRHSHKWTLMCQPTLFFGFKEMRRVCREHFPRHRGLTIPTCITARAWRTLHDAYRGRYLAVSIEICSRQNVPGVPGACATRHSGDLSIEWIPYIATIAMTVPEYEQRLPLHTNHLPRATLLAICMMRIHESHTNHICCAVNYPPPPPPPGNCRNNLLSLEHSLHVR